MNSRPATLILGICLAIAALPVTAVEVYKWTDENGVIHFSQTEPGNQVESVSTLEVLGEEEMGIGPGAIDEDDPYGYKAHREEMDALWAEIEQRREAARQREAAAPSPQVVYVPYETGYPYIYPVYGLRPPHRPGRPPHRPRPDPEPPGPVTPGTSTLKRP